ncbi:MAG: pyridoxine 5'-phosphate synthase [Candidatus Omnitrophica bacterium]|nr:pyridoxine 5'-phosphate synthase [Candidatus Omnitrophota bacterium]
MATLGVNIDHVATLRQARGGFEPEPLFAALLVQSAGAESVVVHLREDRRHIKERDLYLLKELVKVKLNLEMSVQEDIVAIACKVKPDQATLVPEKRKELTTEGGIDVLSGFKKIKQVVERLKREKIAVSLFIDPDIKQIAAAKKSGVAMIELHTGRYSLATNQNEQDRHFRKLEAAARYAKSKNLRVFAGHGLNYCNASRVSGIKDMEELNIGHSIISRAVFVGLGQAIREMKALIK